MATTKFIETSAQISAGVPEFAPLAGMMLMFAVDAIELVEIGDGHRGVLRICSEASAASGGEPQALAGRD